MKHVGLIKLPGGEKLTLDCYSIIDTLWRRRDNRLNVVKDTKTTKMANIVRKENEYRMSVALKLYCWMMGCNEAVVDLIVLKKPLKRPKPDSPNPTELYRFPLQWTDEQLSQTVIDFRDTIEAWLGSIYRRLNNDAPMTGAPRQCSWPSPCPYLDVCNLPENHQRLDWILNSSDFKDKEDRELTSDKPAIRLLS